MIPLPNKKTVFIFVQISLIILLGHLNIFAQDDELWDMSIEELMEIPIEVSSTESVNIFNTTSNVTLIDRETILRYDYQTVAEAVRSVESL